MVPVHILQTSPNDDPSAAPHDAMCYLVGKNGIFKQIRNPFYSVIARVDGIAHLADIGDHVSLNVPKLPRALFFAVEAFFAEVFVRFKSEAVVILAVNPTTKEWRVRVPRQRVRGLAVSYGLDDLAGEIDGFSVFGTIHSHANIGAFHSGTDDQDEVHFDGLHITIGDLDKSTRSYSARWMLSGVEFKAELPDVVENEHPSAFDPQWLDCVSEDKTPTRMALLDESDHLPGRASPLFDDDPYVYLEALRDEIDEHLQDLSPFFR